MLLLSLSEGAGSRVVEVVSPTKAEGLEVPGNRKESDFSCFYQDFKLCGLTSPICFRWRMFSLQAFAILFQVLSILSAHVKGCMVLVIFNQLSLYQSLKLIFKTCNSAKEM